MNSLSKNKVDSIFIISKTNLYATLQEFFLLNFFYPIAFVKATSTKSWIGLNVKLSKNRKIQFDLYTWVVYRRFFRLKSLSLNSWI